MISEISGLTGFVEDSPYTEKTEDALGRDDFLKLFLAQLNHQDPLNPMDSSQFSSQLAQFSSLEQLFNVNENLETMKAVQDSSSQLQALDLIGKEIEAEGNVLSLEHDRLSTGSFSLESSADCTVLILFENGYPVREIQMGTLKPGEHSFEWDGRDMDGEIMDEGIYGFEINAMDPYGDLIPVDTRIKGFVKRVSLDGDQPMVYVGDMPVELSQIMDVNLADSQEE